MRNRICLSALLLVTVSAAHALETLNVTIQPILVANSDGSNLSPDLSYLNYANKIWAQADIKLNFLSAVTLNDSTYNTFDYSNSWSLVNAPGHGQNSNPLVINAWFVDSVANGSVYGFGYLDLPYMVMDTTKISGYSDLGRVDTFSHELGHVLNLPHYDEANPLAVDFNRHLMSSGPNRLVPQTLGDVAPDGQGWDYLDSEEIEYARSSQFALPTAAVPEPATLLTLGLGVAALMRRKRSA